MTPQLREEIAEYDRISAVSKALHARRADHLLKRSPAFGELRKRIVSSPDWAVQEKDYVLKKSPERTGRYMWLPEVEV